MENEKVSYPPKISVQIFENFNFIQSHQNRTKGLWDRSKSMWSKVEEFIYTMQVIAKRYLEICKFGDMLNMTTSISFITFFPTW